MVFVYPSFLWALLAILVPIVVHLFNFKRYKKVYFTNVKFLKVLKQESRSKSRLKEILILTARCLTITSLVLAFCQPVIPGDNSTELNTGANAIGIYIDNSFSMANVSKQGPVFEIAKTRAKTLVKVFGNADKFQIITNDFEGKHQRFYTKEDAINAIDELKLSASVKQLSDVVKRQKEFLNTSRLPNKKIYLLSDAQKSTSDLQNVKNDSLFKTTLIVLEPNQVNNISVDSCWFETPLQQKGFIQKLHASIINQGNSKIEAGSAKLSINKQQIAIASFSLDVASKNEIQFTFECKKEGFNFGSVKIEDYPVTFDDELFFAFNSRINMAVCLINGKNQQNAEAFNKLFKNDSLFKFQAFKEEMIEYSAFGYSDVIILNQLSEISSGLLSELIKFTQKGGALVVIPSETANLSTYNSALTALKLPNLAVLDSQAVKTELIEMGSGFYSGVFEKLEERLNLPIVNKHYRLNTNNNPDFESLLTLQNKDVLFGTTTFNNAKLYLFSAPLNERSTNFNKHALFVPTFYQLCFKSLNPEPLFQNVGGNTIISLKSNGASKEQPPHLKKINSEVDIIPEVRVLNNGLNLYTQGQINEPGFYQIVRNNDSLLPLAFNFSRKESDLSCYKLAELEEIIKDKNLLQFSLIVDSGLDFSKQVLEAAEGKKLWKIFIILALMFISIEVALLRFLK